MPKIHSKNFFNNWFADHKDFLYLPNASVILDTALGDEGIRTAIKEHKSIAAKYREWDKKIANDYADLIEVSLYELLKVLRSEDIENASAFSDKSKATEPLRQYFLRIEIITFFIKNDIEGHKIYEAKLSAFGRWISIANTLKEKRCFEGSFLVISTLISLEKAFIKNLSQEKTDLLNSLELWSSPSNNFGGIRNTLQENEHLNPYPVMAILGHDLTMLHELGNISQENPEQLARYELRKEELINTLMRAKEYNIVESTDYFRLFMGQIIASYEARTSPRPQYKREEIPDSTFYADLRRDSFFNRGLRKLYSLSEKKEHPKTSSQHVKRERSTSESKLQLISAITRSRSASENSIPDEQVQSFQGKN